MAFFSKVSLQAAVARLGAEVEAMADEPAYHADASYLFARLGSQPVAAEKAAINAFILGNVEDGTWGKLHWFKLYGSVLPEIGLRNMRPTPAYDATVEGVAPVHTPKVGRAGGGNGRFRNAFTVAAANQNNHHIGLVSLTAAGQASGAAMGNGSSSIWPRNGANQSYQRVNANSSVSVGSITDGSGHIILSRTNAANYADIRNGVLRGTRAKASTAPSSVPFSEFGNFEQSDVMCPISLFAMHAGLGFTLEEAQAFTARVATLQAALAAI